MYIANPKKTVSPQSIDCNAGATVTMSFMAASALYVTPAKIVLMIDNSAGMSDEQQKAVKDSAHQFIDDVAIATKEGGAEISADSNLAIVSCAGTSKEISAPEHDVNKLHCAVDSIVPDSTEPNYKTAFEKAESMFPLKEKSMRHIVVLFTHSAQKSGADADAAVKRMKDNGAEVYCIGLLDNPEKLNIWASEPIKNHVEYTNDFLFLKEKFRRITAEVVLAGGLDIKIQEKVTPDFKIKKILSVSDGTAEIKDSQNLIWSIDYVGIPKQSVTPSLTFEIEHIGKTSGMKDFSESVIYEDRLGQKLTFPSPKIEVGCSGGGSEIIAEPCPVPRQITVDGCSDFIAVGITPITLSSLGRVAQIDVNLKNICPNRKVSVAVILTEIDSKGNEHNRGMKTLLVSAFEGTKCKDVVLKCITFVLPEALDTDDTPDSICNERMFKVRVFANYADTDFICCG